MVVTAAEAAMWTGCAATASWNGLCNTAHKWRHMTRAVLSLMLQADKGHWVLTCVVSAAADNARQSVMRLSKIPAN